MITKICKAFMASYYLAKAFDYSSRHEDSKALIFLDKCQAITPKVIYSELLLRGFLYCEKKNFLDSISVSRLALEKIDKSCSLNKDEKIYLSAYAKDTINMSYIGRGEKEKVTPVDLSFNISNVRSIHRRRFKVIIGDRRSAEM